MKIELPGLVAIFATLALLVTVLAGWKAFTLNSQAWYMWQTVGHDPTGVLLSGHPHGLRYLVYYPVFAVAEFATLSPDFVFSCVCVLILFLISMLIARIDVDVWGTQGHVWRRDTVIFCMFAMSMLMNGRLLLAFCGYLLILVAGADWFTRREWKFVHAISVVLGCLLAGVSSGTLLVAMALSAGIVFVAFLMDLKLLKNNPIATVSIAITLALFVGYALIGIGKNIAFYGGDEAAIVRMLDHGVGGDIARSVGLGDLVEREDAVASGGTLGAVLQYWWVGVVAAALIARSYGWRPSQTVREASPAQNLVHLSIAIAMVGGLFGYSVLMMGFIPLLVFVSERIGPLVSRMRFSGK